MGELRTSAENEAPPEWVPLTVKCTFDTEDGPPAAGVKVELRGNTDRTVGIGGDLTSDATGVVNFGKVLYARYDISCTMPNGMSLRQSVSARPGQEKAVTIVCPSSPPPSGAVKFDIEPPEELRSAPMYYLAVINRAVQVVGNQHWYADSSAMDAPVYVLGAEGNLLGELDAELSKVYREASQRRRGRMFSGSVVESLNHASFSPAIERPGYEWSGTMLALIAEPGDATETADSEVADKGQ